MTYELITLSQAKAAMKTEINTATFNERVRELVRESGRVLEELTGRTFVWRVERIDHDAYAVKRGGHVDGRVLKLLDECQSVISVVNGDGQTIPEAAYTLLPQFSTNYKQSIALDDLTYQWLPMPDRAKRAIQVTAAWGWRGSWRPHGLTLNGAMDANTTTCTVSNAATLEAGVILKIESEYVLITDVTDNTLTVERAYQGTTAAAHADGTVTYRFVPDEIVQRIIKRMLRWYSALEDNPLFATQQLGDITVPADITAMPKDLQDMILAIKKPEPIEAVF